MKRLALSFFRIILGNKAVLELLFSYESEVFLLYACLENIGSTHEVKLLEPIYLFSFRTDINQFI